MAAINFTTVGRDIDFTAVRMDFINLINVGSTKTDFDYFDFVTSFPCIDLTTTYFVGMYFIRIDFTD